MLLQVTQYSFSLCKLNEKLSRRPKVRRFFPHKSDYYKYNVYLRSEIAILNELKGKKLWH